MKRIYCGKCGDYAVQRIVKPSFISFRCKKCKLSKAEAKRLGVAVFDMTKEPACR